MGEAQANDGTMSNLYLCVCFCAVGICIGDGHGGGTVCVRACVLPHAHIYVLYKSWLLGVFCMYFIELRQCAFSFVTCSAGC